MSYVLSRSFSLLFVYILITVPQHMTATSTMMAMNLSVSTFVPLSFFRFVSFYGLFKAFFCSCHLITLRSLLIHL